MSEAFSKKKKSGKSHGWEEAGCEFYQENYCSDWDGFPKDTFAIRTLLPSKQTRLATCRENPTGTHELNNARYWQSIASTTKKHTKYNDIQFSTLPDLSQVHTDEERIWEEMLQIKLLPLSMQQKRFLKTNLQTATKLRLQGLNELKWKQRKIFQRLGVKWSELITKFKLWQSSLKCIEGHFGTGVVAYFLFMRWLFVLNFITFIVILIFTILPNMYVQENYKNNCNVDAFTNFSKCDNIVSSNINSNTDKFIKMFPIIPGQEIDKFSLMYYGAYSKEIIGGEPQDIGDMNTIKYPFYYNLPLAYIFVVIICFSISLLAIVRAAAREFKYRLIEGNWQSYQYCNLIFGGWDYCIHNEKSANIKHRAVYTEMKYSIQLKRIIIERSFRSKQHMYKLILIRILINLTVVCILLLSAYFIYVLFNLSLQNQNIFFDKKINATNHTDINANDINANDFKAIILKIFIEFVPYIAIVCLNLFLPTTFSYMCKFEKYSPLFEIKISLFRTIFLRLASLLILLSHFYYIVIPQSMKSNICWETFVGQQFYKLVLTDFIIHLLVTFCINFPRSICARKINNNFIKFIGEQEFELPKHVLDIVYIQTICWLGIFYSPFLPALVTIVLFFMFYIKKFQCLVNSTPSKILYGSSRSKSMFMVILLVSYFLAVVPITYAIAEITPSLNCGPFEGLKSVWDTPLLAFAKLPVFFQNIIYFFGTAAFAIPCFIILLLFLYYFYAISDANKNMVNVLKNQLILEGHDKQFLLNRLSVFIKQHQDVQEQNK